MRISDWSSDVCSSDLRLLAGKASHIVVARRDRHQGPGLAYQLLVRAEHWNALVKRGAGQDVAVLSQERRGSEIEKIDACRLQFRQLRRDLLGARLPVIAQRDLASDPLEIQLIRQREIRRASWRERVCQYV